jgi:DNA-binding transcriptional LysR family regulator
MNLNHLAIFHAVAEQGSISRGAERLFISQPAVSKQIGELERSLGTRLFDRLPRGVRLTEAGALLAGYARRLFALEAEAERALSELKGLDRGRLLVGASVTIGNYLLPGLLAEFGRRHPGVDVRLDIANTEAIQQRLAEGELDIGLTEGFAEDDALEAEVFGEDVLVVIAPPAHPLVIRARASGGPVTPERLCLEPFVVREPGSGTLAVAERALAARGLSLRPALTLSHAEAIKRAVIAGAGLAIVSSLTIAQELAAGTLAVIPVSDLPLRRALHLLRLRGRHEGHATRAFLALLGETTPRLLGETTPRSAR